MREHLNIFLLIGVFLQLSPSAAQLTYTIGVQGIYSTGANLTLTMSSNKVLKIVSVTIQDASNIAALTAETTRIYNLGIDYLIYMYNQTASLVTNNINTLFNKTVPYLVLPQISIDPILNPNMFYIDYQEKIGSDASRALLTYLNAVNIVYIDFGPTQTSQNLLSFGTFGQTLTVVSNFSWPPLLTNLFTQNNQRFYVCAIPLYEDTLIVSLLTEAMYKGQLNPGKVWIFNDVTSNITRFNIFQPFASVGADIYGLSIDFSPNITVSNTSQLSQYVARDYVRLIATSINTTTTAKPSNASLQLLNTVLPVGELVNNAKFDATTHIANGTTINILKINAMPAPIPKFNYNGTLIEYNVSGLVFKLNDSRITVRIGVLLSTGYFMQNSQNAYYGFSVALLNELLKLSNFKYVFVFPNDSLTGEVVNVNSTGVYYSGIVSLINQSMVDMSIIPMFPNYIGNVIYPSDMILNYQISMLTRPANETINFTLLFVPFTYNVWIGIAGIIFIMTLAFFTINKISPNNSSDGSNKQTEQYSFSYSLLIMYSSFVTAKLKIKPRQPSLHIFAFILWFSTLTLVITYASNMLPFLIKPSKAYPFTKVQDFFPNSSLSGYTWGFVSNSVDLQLIMNDSALSILYNTALSKWPSTMFINDSQLFNSMAIDKFILFQNDNKNEYLLNRICNTTQINIPITDNPLILPMSTTWKQRFEMKSLITQLISSGTINSLLNRYFSLGHCAKDVDTLTPSPQALTLLGSTGLFMLPILGIVIGLLCVLCQVIWIKLCRCKQNMNMERFKYGEMYTGKVNSIENDGVWASINERERPYFISSTSLHSDLKKKYTPKELGIKLNDNIQLKYFGKDPVNGYKRFCKYSEEESV